MNVIVVIAVGVAIAIVVANVVVVAPTIVVVVGVTPLPTNRTMNGGARKSDQMGL